MAQLIFSGKENKVIVTDITQDNKVIAKIEYDRTIEFYSPETLSVETRWQIRMFARYDNICESLEQPYEKLLKPVGYKSYEHKIAVRKLIEKIAGTDSHFEYDETHGDIYVKAKEDKCRKLCAFMQEIGVRASIQTDLYEYCTVIYSNLIYQIHFLHDLSFK